MNNIQIGKRVFELNNDCTVPVHILLENSEKLKSVHTPQWVMATEWGNEFERSLLKHAGVDIENMTPVASYFKDESGWCDTEGKYEYYYDEKVLLAPKSLVKEWTVDYTWEDVAAEQGFNEYV
jgi:hypothetical protein